MKKQYIYSTDTDFLKLINKQKIQDQYVKITLLDWNENPLEEIQGLATGGSESINGNSAVRRTCNLSMLVKNEMYSITDVNNLISINKKIFLEVGVQNRTIYYPEEAVIWFPQGIFVVNSCNISHSLSGISISLQLKDKMCLLNGECGGTIPASTQFDEWETIDDKGNILISKPRISQIIRESINHFGGEQLSKILVSDIDDRIKSVVKWTGNTPLYLVKNNGNYQVTTDYQEISDMESTTGTFNQDTTSFNSSSDFKIDNIKIDGKSTQETSIRGINYCPDINEWSFGGGAYIENGYIVLPNNGAYALSPYISLDKQQYYWFAYAKVYTETEDNKLLCNTSYFDSNKEVLKGNGNAVAIGDISIDNDYYWTFGGASATEYGQALYNAKYMRLQFSYNSNYSNGLYKIKNPMISSTSQSSFISYVPNSPSPDYPSEIECVKGKNLWDNSNYETNTSSGVEIKNNGFKFVRGEQAGGKYIAKKINVVKGKTYTFSAISSSFGTNYFYICIYRTNVCGTLVKSTIANFLTYTATATEELYFTFIIGSAITEVEASNIQLEKGTVATSYLPYNTIQVKNVGKNLFDYLKLNDDDTVPWTAYQSIGTMFRALPIYVGKNKQVNFSSNVPALTSGNAFYAINNIKNTSSNQININRSRVVNSNDDGYVYLGVVTNRQYYTEVQNNEYWIMISEGTQATSYEPYQENTLNIDLQGNELCSLPNNIKDELVIENGRAKIIKRVSKYNITGNEAWALSSTESQPYINFSNYVNDCKYPAITTELPNLLSNYYLQIARNNLYDGRITLSPGKALIIYDTIHNTSLANFKEWLKSAGVVAYYQLETPTEIDLGEVDTLSAFNGVNNISIISNLPTTFSGNYKYYSGDYGHRTFSYGDDIGFIYSDFTYPTELIGNAGDNVTTILDKIKSTLGNYEYFYEVYGNCRFQEIKNYLNTKHATAEIEKLSNDDYLVDMSKGKVVYELDNSLGTSYSNSPQYMNIKNDYVVWGTRKTGDGVSIPIRYHLAIDKKPKIGNIYNCFFYLDSDDGLEKATIPIEYQSRSSFPKVGVNKTYYLDKSTNVIYMWDGKTESYLTVSGLETKGYPTLSDFPSQGDSKKIYVDQSNSNRYTWAIDQQSNHYLDIQNQKKSAYLDYINTIAPLEDKISQNEEDIKKDQSILEEIGTTEQINAAIADINADIVTQQATVNMIKQEIATLKEKKEQATSEEEKQMIQTEIDNYTATLELEEMALENLQNQLATLQGYLTQRPILEQEILDKQKEIESLSEKIKNAKTLYDNKIETLSTQEYEYVQIENKELTKVKTTDWRTELYLQGVIAEPLGVNSNYYYAELAAEWPRIYNLKASSYTENGETIYTGDFYQEYKDHPETLPYFLDFIDSNAEIGKFSVSNIGRRSLVESSNDYNCVFEPEIPDLVLIESGQDDTAKKRQECENKGQAYIQVPSSIYNMLALGGSLNSCYVRIKDLLYNHTKYNESIQIQCLPIYQIEPNTRIRVRDVESNISGDYIINTISVPFTPNGTMSISATRALEKL